MHPLRLRLSFSFAAIGSLAISMAAPPDRVSVSLDSVTKSAAPRESVFVRVVVANDTDSSRFFYSVLSATPNPAFPDGELRFMITDPDGVLLRIGKPAEIPGLRAEPSCRDLWELPTGMSIAFKVDLTSPFMPFTFTKKGRYRIAAHITFHAKSWLETRIREGGDHLPDHLREFVPSRSLFIDGEYITNTVVVEIK